METRLWLVYRDAFDSGTLPNEQCVDTVLLSFTVVLIHWAQRVLRGCDAETCWDAFFN